MRECVIQRNPFLGPREAPSPWTQQHQQHHQNMQQQHHIKQPKPVQQQQLDITALATEVAKILQRMNLGLNGERR